MMERAFGIDISTWQGGLNFESVKNEGVEFVMIRAGYTGSLDGVSKAIDNQFVTFYNNAKSYGLKVGAYWFSRATSYAQGRSEAEYMYNNCLKGRQFEYPIAIDVEDTVYQVKAGKHSITEAIKGFCEYLETKDYYVSVYANTKWFKNYIDTPKLFMYDKWIANWGSSKPTYCEAGMWQFGGESNYIRSNKIAGMVIDQNFAYKDYPIIIMSNGLNGYGESKVENQITKSIEELAYEVIAGKWGNGVERRVKLTQSGYDYSAIQDRVNEISVSKSQIIHTVKKGDYLIYIGNLYDADWRKIASDNNILSPYTIYEGQKLIINK